MDKLNIIIIILSVILICKIAEGFTSILNGYDKMAESYDEPKIIDYKPTKTSDLIAFCDEKRNQCISY